MGLTLGGHDDNYDNPDRFWIEDVAPGELCFKRVFFITHFVVKCYRCRGSYLGEQYAAGDYWSRKSFKKHLLKEGWSQDQDGWHHNDCPYKNYDWQEWKKSTENGK